MNQRKVSQLFIIRNLAKYSRIEKFVVEVIKRVYDGGGGGGVVISSKL